MRPRALFPAISVLALGAPLALAACGGDDSASALDKSLGYLPADAPLALTISTDVEGEQYQQLGALIERFPGGDQLVQGIQSSIEQEGADFEEQVRPLLGNELVVGAPDVESLNAEEDQFVGALAVSDEDALQQVIDEQAPTEVGDVDGATLYDTGDGDFIAVDEDVVLFADSQERLEAAIAQSGEDDGLSEEAFDEALGDLPEESLLSVYGDMPAILESDPDAQQAREVAWVGALETLAVTATAEEEGLAVNLAVSTDPEALTDDQLPIAAGTEDPPPVVADEDEIGVGLRDPSQIVDFVQLAAEETGAGEIDLAKSQISERLGIDIDEDVTAQLTGEASVAVDLEGNVGFRSELADPAAFEDTLEQVSDELPEAAAGIGAEGLRLDPPAGGSLYEFSAPDSQPLAIGVVGGVLVAAADPQQATELAGAAPEEVEGAEGSLTMRADAATLAAEALAPLALLIGDPAAFAAPLGDLTGSLEADTSGLRGRFLLTVE